MEETNQDDLPPTTMPGDLNFCVKGFHDEEVGKQLAYATADVIRVVGSYVDLSTLDGVTIGCDYNAALLELDRGIEGLRPLTPSDTQEMQGVAMSPAVMRDGEVRTHLVFDAAFVVSLISEEATDEDKKLTVGLIAHECAHVEITAAKEEAIPDARFGTVIEGYERGVMFQMAEICWDEYAACRMSAMFNANQNETFAETVIACANTARENSDNAIRSYRDHGEVDRLIAEAGPPLNQPIKAVAYLLGGMDAEEVDWTDFPAVREALEEADYLDLIDDLWAELKRLWDSRDDWEPTLDVFGGLEAIAKDVFDSGGLFFNSDDEGNCRVDVPFTPHTMPY